MYKNNQQSKRHHVDINIPVIYDQYSVRNMNLSIRTQL